MVEADMTVKVKDLMSYPVATVRPKSAVIEAIQIMVKGRRGCVLVAREGLLKECMGIVTTGQIFRRVFAVSLDPTNVLVDEIMTPAPLIAIGPNASAKEAAEMMLKHGIRRLPVIEKGMLVGMITSKDLLRCIQ
jgi:CBS domain-containing protein